MKRGLTASQLKLIGLFSMTIDHLAAYGWQISIFSKYSLPLRTIGRIAAPLFLFLLTESVRHTRSRTRFLLRLYFGAVGVGLFTALTNYFFGEIVGYFTVRDNILADYFYTAFYIIILEEITDACKLKKWKKAFLCTLVIVCTVLPAIYHNTLYALAYNTFTHNQAYLLWDITDSFLIDPFAGSFSILFDLMGILMYFSGNKYISALILAAFSLSYSFEPQWNKIFFIISPYPFFAYPQCWMILALPFIILYNGQRGNNRKWFFYAYYPLHRYAISVFQYVYTIFIAP